MKLKSHCVATPAEIPGSRMRAGKILDMVSVKLQEAGKGVAYSEMYGHGKGPQLKLYTITNR